MLVVAIAAGIVVNVAATGRAARAPTGAASTSRAPSSTCSPTCSPSSPPRWRAPSCSSPACRARGRHRRPPRRRPDDPLRLGPAARLRPRAPRGRPQGPRPERDRPHARRPGPRGRGARPSRVGGHLGHAVAVRPCHGESRMRHPVASARKLREMLRERFGIDHTTLQVEARHEGPLEIEPLKPAGHLSRAALRDPEARGHLAALRLPARGRRRARLVGGAEGPLDRPARQAPGDAGRGPPAATTATSRA